MRGGVASHSFSCGSWDRSRPSRRRRQRCWATAPVLSSHDPIPVRGSTFAAGPMICAGACVLRRATCSVRGPEPGRPQWGHGTQAPGPGIGCSWGSRQRRVRAGRGRRGR
ncbi:putative protein without homology [Propionibacterium freudenreichii subsp. shermanii]|nr:putative protein without homology [Propionibacterium freudenreichii subsp. shermanii]